MDTQEIAVTLRVPCVLTLNSGVPECLENAQPIDERTMKEVKSLRLSQSSAIKGTCSLLEVVASYMLSSHAANVHGESSANSTPLSINRNLLVLIYSTCMRGVMLHAAETWAKTVATLNPLRLNDA